MYYKKILYKTYKKPILKYIMSKSKETKNNI